MHFSQNILPLLSKNLEIHLQQHLRPSFPQTLKDFEEACFYTIRPPAKRFRPLLLAASFEDFHGGAFGHLERPDSDLSKLCSSVEIHHTYTLIHDDLPCMDNDDTRRKRPALHKIYGEGVATLVGDGLLNISYALLAELESPLANMIRKIYSKAVGPGGLIQGQYLDISCKMTESLSYLLATHHLKTARLMQLPLLLGCLLGLHHKGLWEKAPLLKLYRLGYHLGLVFQFLNDLKDKNSSPQSHERKVNPWPSYSKFCTQKIQKGLSILRRKGELGSATSSVIWECLPSSFNVRDSAVSTNL